MMDRWKASARRLKQETCALYLAYRDPRTPWHVRLFAAAVVAYALSPIDLIPDPIPMLGYLDDLVLVPLGMALALRMIPSEVMSDARARVAAMGSEGLPLSRVAAAAIVLIWVLFAVLAAVLVWQLVR